MLPDDEPDEKRGEQADEQLDEKLALPDPNEEPDIAAENGPHETEFRKKTDTDAAMSMSFWPPIP